MNLKNPAAYAKLGVTAGDDFGVTVYTAGASRNAYRLDTATDREGTSVVNLDYLSLAFSWVVVSVWASALCLQFRRL